MIRRGEIEVRREGRRVFVRMEGPEYVSDDELLRRALGREDKLQRTVWELDRRASELERERDEARHAASASRQAYEEMEEAYRKERAAHGPHETVGHQARPGSRRAARHLRPAHVAAGRVRVERATSRLGNPP